MKLSAVHVHSHIVAHAHHHIAVGVDCHIIGNGVCEIAVVLVEEMLTHRFASSIFNNLVFHAGAFDSVGVVVCTVRFPVREVICFFLVGITMANDDVFEDIAAAGGKRADGVERRVISTVRSPAGGFFHQPSGIIIRLLLRTENPVPYVYGLIL